MGASNRESKKFKFYGLKAKADATNNPHFALQEKVNDKWQNTSTFNTISGNIIGAGLEEKEFQGVKENVFVFIMEDGEESMKITMTHNNITHGIINALANEPSKLFPYQFSVSKKQAANGKWYGNGWVKKMLSDTQTEDVKWAIDPKSAPKSEQVMVGGQPFKQGGKDVYDHSKPRAFWEQFFKDKIVTCFGEPKRREQPATASTGSSAPATSTEPDQDFSDLPF